jgi:hypothetical protein
MNDAARHAFTYGFAPQFTEATLIALRDALVSDDPRLMQGRTTEPEPVLMHHGLKIECACAIGFCAWVQNQSVTVGEVLIGYGDMLDQADRNLGRMCAYSPFLHAFDDTPREIVFPAMAELVNEILSERQQQVAA